MSSEANDKFMIKKFVIGPLATNCYVVHEKVSRKGVIIDPGWHDENIGHYIKENDIDISYTLNTHGHPDHTMGNDAFGYPSLIHRLDGPFLDSAEKLLEGNELIAVGGLEFKIIHTPGHTPGGISILLDDILFSGDALFCEGIGRTDLAGGDQGLLLRSIKEKLMVLPNEVRVLPGHGPETTIGHERQNNPYI